MLPRDEYIKSFYKLLNKPVIKVITGLRRTGKSVFLQLVMDSLKKEGTPQENILYINKESLDFDFIHDYKDFYSWFSTKSNGKKGQVYLFVDEIQEISEWEKAITSLLADNKADITITGSNAHLLSSELATLISGRFFPFQIYPLSFAEYVVFSGKRNSTAESLFKEYLKYGGLPGVHFFNNDSDSIYQYINSVFNTIILKDVVERYKIRNVRLLENLITFIFDNIGNIFSAKKVADYLKSQRLGVGVETVQNYISFLEATFSIYKVPRYDIKGKRYLEFNEKYYCGETGLRQARLGYRESDISGILENLVFLHLKRKGYAVSVGKIGSKEIDFIAEKNNEKHYIQVCYLLASENTIEREFSAFDGINDNYPRTVLSMDIHFGNDYQGIRRFYIPDFLADEVPFST